MSTYTLNISIDTNGLKALTQAGQKVTIVKQSSTGKPVAWISFQPQTDNKISWTEQYSVYSSTTNIQSGAVIQTSSEATAVGGSSYNLNTAGYFDPGVSGAVGANTYQIKNSDPNLTVNGIEMVTGGLVQGATVNGGVVSAPMCATGILFKQHAEFTPIETIMVYTSSYANNGIVISRVSGDALTVEYTTNTEASIKYNDQNNVFIPA